MGAGLICMIHIRGMNKKTERNIRFRPMYFFLQTSRACRVIRNFNANADICVLEFMLCNGLEL